MVEGTWAEYRKFMGHEYREGTAYQYWNRCNRFLIWAAIRTPQQLTNLNSGIFLKYDDYLKKQGITQRNTHGFAIRSMLQYFGLNELSGKVPARRDTVQAIPRWMPDPILMMMLGYAPHIRLKALTAVAYDLALRVSEAMLLDIVPNPNKAYIDLETGSARVYRLKTKQFPWQLLQVSKSTLDLLNVYNEQERVPDKTALFTTKPYREGGNGGGRMSKETAETDWRKWMKNLGLVGWEFKMLRHSRLTWMSVQGNSLTDIAKFAGHSSPNPTLIYTHLSMMWEKTPMMFLEELKGSVLYQPAKEMLQKRIQESK